MDDAIFNDLLKSTKDMVKHARGEAIQGVTVTELPEVDIKQVRERVPSAPPRSRFKVFRQFSAIIDVGG